MAFVVIASWKARAGEEGRVREILERMSAASRQEPGCQAYQAQVSLQDPNPLRNPVPGRIAPRDLNGRR